MRPWESGAAQQAQEGGISGVAPLRVDAAAMEARHDNDCLSILTMVYRNAIAILCFP
jgi:hypothetical protein